MSAAQVITQILTTQAANLKAYYPGSQMTVAVDGQRVGDLVDLSGNAKHLTSQFASTYNVAGLAGEAVTPDGTLGMFYRDDCVLGSTAPAEWTILAIVKGGATTNRFAVSCNRSSSTNPFLSIATGNTSLSQSAANLRGVVRDDTPSANTWGLATAEAYGTAFEAGTSHVVAIVRRSGTNYAYIDGTEVGSKTVSQGTITLDRTSVGCDRSTTNNSFFGGAIQHVAFWDKGLTELEVAAISTAANAADSSAPAQPTGLTATAQTSPDSVVLAWTPGDTNEYKFKVQYATASDFTGAVTVEAQARATGFTVTNLAPATLYYFRVYGTNDTGDSTASATASATTAAASTGVVLCRGGQMYSPDNDFGTPATQILSGARFQPKLFLQWGNALNFFPTDTFNRFAIGAIIGASERYVASTYSREAQATSAVYSAISNAKSMLMVTTGAGSITQTADASSVDALGITQAWSALSSNPHPYHWFAVAGSDVTVDSTTGVAKTTTGNQAYTMPIADSDLILIISSVNTAFATTASAGLVQSIGMITPGDSAQAAIGWGATNGTNPSNTCRICRTDRCIAGPVSDAISYGASFVSSSGTTLTLNWDEASGSAHELIFICFKGGKYKILSETQKTSTGAKSSASLGFRPYGAMFFSANAAVSASTSANSTFSIGFTDGTNQGCIWNGEEDNVSPTRCTGAHRSDVAIAHYTAGSTATLVAAATAALGTDTIDFDWTTADGTARETIVLAFGESLPAAPSSLTATANGLTAELAWTDNADNETAQWVEYNKDSEGWSSDWPGAETGEVASDATSWTTPTMPTGSYEFRVRAQNAAGYSDYSNTAIATLTAGGGQAASASFGLEPSFGL